MLGPQLPCDRVEFGCGLLAGNAWFESAGDDHIASVPAAAQRIDDERREHLGVIEETDASFGGKDADHRVRHAIERDALSEYVRTCGELPLPEPVGEQDDWIRSG